MNPPKAEAKAYLAYVMQLKFAFPRCLLCRNTFPDGDGHIQGWQAVKFPFPRQDPWHQTSALAHGLAGETADEGCGYRARQQNRPNGLGHDGQGRAIQGTRRACAINEIAPDNRRDVKVGRANST